MIDHRALREENQAALEKLRADMAERQAARERGELPDDAADWRVRMAARQAARDRGEVLHTDWRTDHANSAAPIETIEDEQSPPLTEYERAQVYRHIEAKIEELREEMISEVAETLNEIVDDVNREVKAILERIGNIEIATKARTDVSSSEIKTQLNGLGETLNDLSAKLDAMRSGENVVALRQVN